MDKGKGMTKHREDLVMSALAQTGPTTRYRIIMQAGVSSKRMYEAIDECLKRGDMVVLGLAGDLGVYGVRRDAEILGLKGATYEKRKPPMPTGNKLRPYQSDVFAGTLNRKGMDSPEGRMRFLEGMRR